MASANKSECIAAGLDPKEIDRIAKGISRYAKQAQKLRIQIFGGGAGGHLRFNDGGNGDLIIASLDGSFDGGDGANVPDENGLLRGEYA